MLKILFFLVLFNAVIYASDDNSSNQPSVSDNQKSLKLNMFDEKYDHLSQFDKAYQIYGEKKYKEAFDIWQTLCSDNHAKSCTNLGFLYDTGLVEPDKVKAIKLYEKGCDLGDDLGCSNLGIAYFNGDGVNKDFKLSAKFFSKACDLGSAFGCLNMGYLYENGQGVEQDYKKSALMYDKSCNLENAMACTNYGTLFANGFGVDANLTKAKEFFIKGCDLGDDTGCKYEKVMNDEEFMKKHKDI